MLRRISTALLDSEESAAPAWIAEGGLTPEIDLHRHLSAENRSAEVILISLLFSKGTISGDTAIEFISWLVIGVALGFELRSRFYSSLGLGLLSQPPLGQEDI